jgi:hypothetical protein
MCKKTRETDSDWVITYEIKKSKIKSSDIESKVKDRVKEILNKYDIPFTMPQSGIYGKRGDPDFICCVKGRYVAVETKRPSVGEAGLTPTQRDKRDRITKAGGYYSVVYDDHTLNNLEAGLKLLSDAPNVI